PEGEAPTRLERGRILIDGATLMAYKDGAALDLTPKEFELLRYLATEPEQICSRETLMEKVWNYEGFVGDLRAVDVAVRRLREKLEDDPANPAFIITRRGLGYIFRAEEA
ncbi:MAG: response regulator transcription factor, partial [Oscillospiraceae bacterium]|nr:response regulator transcription factor [Oscillospiraceae bacterium]